MPGSPANPAALQEASASGECEFWEYIKVYLPEAASGSLLLELVGLLEETGADYARRSRSTSSDNGTSDSC